MVTKWMDVNLSQPSFVKMPKKISAWPSSALSQLEVRVIIDGKRRAILVGTLVYEFRRYVGENTIGSPMFPGFKLTVAQLLG
jgi:hypothetical protein